MPVLNMLLKLEDVNAYLTEHGLQQGSAPIVAALLHHGGMASGQPAVMLVIEVDGKKVLAKTSLQILETMLSGMRAASGVRRDP